MMTGTQAAAIAEVSPAMAKLRETSARDEEGKSCGDSSQCVELDIAEAERPERAGGRDQHHGHEQERPRQQQLILHTVLRRGQSRPLRDLDEVREIPERNRVLSAEGISHLRRGEVGADQIMLVQIGLAAHGTNPGVLKFPAAVLEDCFARLDALRRGLIRSVLKHRDAVELEALIGRPRGVKDGRAVGAILAQPSAGVLGLEQRVFAVESLGVKPLGFGAGAGGERIVERHEHDAEQEGNDHGGEHELPYRYAGGAHDDELRRAAQHQENADRADQHGEGEGELGEGGQTKQSHPGEQEAGNIAVVVAGAPQHLDEIDEEDQHAADCEHRQHGDEEAQGKIAGERPRCTDAWHLRFHFATIPRPVQNFMLSGTNLSWRLSLDRSSGDILTCATRAATIIAPIGIT